ncbi:acetyltransferase [Acuticoccus sp.]|uniref:acetyltransferase n=1 Tax=Acuticoccus sp. TaxID=1904378 RepID=UPI003B5168ED
MSAVPSDKPVVIFGIGQLADLAHYYFTTDTARTVAGFTVDAAYVEADQHLRLPVAPFEELTRRFPPSEHDMFLPISFKQMNGIRRDRFHAVKDAGYNCATYISSRATTFDNLVIGENCFVFEDNTIQPFVTIGDNCILWSGNHIGHHTRIGDHVFITSHVVVSGACTIGDMCFLGVNATIRDEMVLGPKTLVGMGATILAPTEEGEVWLAPRSVKAKAKSDRFDRISPKAPAAAAPETSGD